jgi:hypothetical protein
MTTGLTAGDNPDDPTASGGRTKLLTCQTWVLQVGWYEYALAHPGLVPFPLTDRSPCQDPFVDPFAEPQDRRPVISGLCRGIKNFSIGDRFIYIARIADGVAKRLKLADPYGSNYFAVAALRVTHVWESHREAATAFTSRQYVALPTPTPYPPNLAFSREPEAAAARVCCITFDEDATPPRPHLPDDADDRMWRRHYLAYFVRQRDKRLRAAGCEFEAVDGRPCLQLLPGRAPVVTPDWWGGAKMNVPGVDLSEAQAQRFRSAIATGRAADD